jgi:elongation factor 1-alpha
MDKYFGLIVFGHDNAEKNAAIGHLMYLCGGIKMQAIEKYTRQVNEKKRKPSFKYAWIMEDLKAEKEHGTVGDLFHYQFHTPKALFIVNDISGHQYFMNNLTNEISKCDVAILVVSSIVGEFDVNEAQDYVSLVCASNAKKIIVLVNKMDDKTVNYSENRFKTIVSEMNKILNIAGFDGGLVLPISSWTGENIFENTQAMPWWNGPTLIQALDMLASIL